MCILKEVVQQKTIHNKAITEYSIKNEFLEVRFLNIGGAITKIAMAGDNYDENLVLNYADWSNYLDNNYYLNCLIGRTANRISNGKFILDGQEIQLDINSKPHNLHGGADNLTHKIFDVSEIEDGYKLRVILSHQENGFPGNLNVVVYYRLFESRLVINYEATTDATTIINLTHHAYFNLSGNAMRTIYDHELQLRANYIAEIDESSGFTGNLIPLAETRFDFNCFNIVNPIGKEGHHLFEKANGYDHLYVLDPLVRNVVTFKDHVSGRVLRINTSEPALQFYAANFITDEVTFENNRFGEAHLGACFETHKIPFDYESQILRPNETYKQETVFSFYKEQVD